MNCEINCIITNIRYWIRFGIKKNKSTECIAFHCTHTQISFALTRKKIKSYRVESFLYNDEFASRREFSFQYEQKKNETISFSL